MASKKKDGHVTFSGGQVTLQAPNGEAAAARNGNSQSDILVDEGQERGAWGGKVEFLLTMISSAVGLGNVWRFPYLCYRNGGGAFILPYIIMLALVGLPIYYMEMAFGQFASLGPLTIWKVSPLFKGIGVLMLVVSSMICVYYTVIIAWTLFYMFATLAPVLPWSSCVANETAHTPVWWLRGRCEASVMNTTPNGTANGTANVNTTGDSGPIWGTTNVSLDFNVVTPPAHYFYDRVLNISPGIDEMGKPQWLLLACLLLAWILVAAVLIKGVEILGKVSYFTAIFPYVMLLVLIINGLTLPGSGNGVRFYFEPVWWKLADPRVWMDAAVQIFYSLSVCTGGLITMSSYNGFSNNCQRDAVMVAIINCFTSIIAGIAIFSILGYMADLTHKDISEVAEGGPGLVFIVYPEGLSKLPFGSALQIIITFLFFFMMFTLGFGSSLTMVENVLSSLLDEWPVFRKTKLRNALSRVGICVIFFVLGIPMVCEGGAYLLNIVDSSTGGFPLLVCALAEVLIVNWVYGYEKFAEDIELMLGKPPNWYWKITWKYISGTVIVVVMIFSIINFEDITYGVYEYPRPFLIMGYLIQAFPILCIPYCALRYFCIKSGLWSKAKEMTHPEGDWGPAKRENRRGKYAEDDGKIEDDYEFEEEVRRARAASKASIASGGSAFDTPFPGPTPPPVRAPIYQNRAVPGSRPPIRTQGTINAGFAKEDVVSQL